MLIIWHILRSDRSRSTHIFPHILTICGPSEMSGKWLFYQFSWLVSVRFDDFMQIPPSKITKKLIFLHISTCNRSRPMGPGPTSPSDFFLEMANCTGSSLILPLNYIKMSSYFWYQVKSSSSFVTNSIWNFEVSHIFKFSRWLLLLLCWHCTITYQWNLSLSHFQARLWCIFENMMSLQWGFPQNQGFPQFHVITFVMTP